MTSIQVTRPLIPAGPMERAFMFSKIDMSMFWANPRFRHKTASVAKIGFIFMAMFEPVKIVVFNLR